jgi:hypothetical protein
MDITLKEYMPWINVTAVTDRIAQAITGGKKYRDEDDDVKPYNWSNHYDSDVSSGSRYSDTDSTSYLDTSSVTNHHIVKVFRTDDETEDGSTNNVGVYLCGAEEKKEKSKSTVKKVGLAEQEQEPKNNKYRNEKRRVVRETREPETRNERKDGDKKASKNKREKKHSDREDEEVLEGGKEAIFDEKEAREYLKRQLAEFLEKENNIAKREKKSKKAKKADLKKYLKKCLKTYMKQRAQASETKQQQKNMKSSVKRMITDAVDQNHDKKKTNKNKQKMDGDNSLRTVEEERSEQEEEDRIYESDLKGSTHGSWSTIEEEREAQDEDESRRSQSEKLNTIVSRLKMLVEREMKRDLDDDVKPRAAKAGVARSQSEELNNVTSRQKMLAEREMERDLDDDVKPRAAKAGVTPMSKEPRLFGLDREHMPAKNDDFHAKTRDKLRQRSLLDAGSSISVDETRQARNGDNSKRNKPTEYEAEHEELVLPSPHSDDEKVQHEVEKIDTVRSEIEQLDNSKNEDESLKPSNMVVDNDVVKALLLSSDDIDAIQPAFEGLSFKTKAEQRVALARKQQLLDAAIVNVLGRLQSLQNEFIHKVTISSPEDKGLDSRKKSDDDNVLPDSVTEHSENDLDAIREEILRLQEMQTAILTENRKASPLRSLRE